MHAFFYLIIGVWLIQLTLGKCHEFQAAIDLLHLCSTKSLICQNSDWLMFNAISLVNFTMVVLMGLFICYMKPRFHWCHKWCNEECWNMDTLCSMVRHLFCDLIMQHLDRCRSNWSFQIWRIDCLGNYVFGCFDLWNLVMIML